MLRTCQIIESAGAGVGRHVLDLTQALVNSSVEVHVVFSGLRAEDEFVAALKSIGCPASRVDMRRSIGVHDVLVAMKVRGHLTGRNRFDIIHGHSSKGGALARISACYTGSRVVYSPHAFAAMDPLARPLKKFAYSRIERGLARATDAILCVSPEEREFARTLRIAEHKLHVVPNGIGQINFRPRADARAAIGLNESDPVIGFVGRLSEQKAPDVLLKAFAQVRREVPAARLAIVGDGSMAGPLRELAATLQIGDAIHWLGACNGRQMMSAFDLLALSSRYEGMPYVALEAMAAGMPIVATRAAGCGMLVEEHVNGFLVDVDDFSALAARIAALLKDPAKRARFGTASRNRVAKFSIDTMAQNTLTIYNHVLRQSTHGREIREYRGQTSSDLRTPCF